MGVPRFSLSTDATVNLLSSGSAEVCSLNMRDVNVDNGVCANSYRESQRIQFLSVFYPSI